MGQIHFLNDKYIKLWETNSNLPYFIELKLQQLKIATKPLVSKVNNKVNL